MLQENVEPSRVTFDILLRAAWCASRHAYRRASRCASRCASRRTARASLLAPRATPRRSCRPFLPRVTPSCDATPSLRFRPLPLPSDPFRSLPIPSDPFRSLPIPSDPSDPFRPLPIHSDPFGFLRSGANSHSRFYELKQLIASAGVELSEATVGRRASFS